ncbi:GerAB/ArcD/ProY family transporter [Cohnella rhizosphaerae]|uniref:Spore germination protein n=1 Tax=Cohnella rhizosphaerae TaxID=1457232 RepID=A0A9X4KQF8_9BACL|nr:GerAB/ArcD/ProY family transporter [Cohnella rhizosphaerae]MDG0809239.1 spore germination protein [Cohnella rhizosphaerae]
MHDAITPKQAAMLLFVFLTGSSIINIPAPLIAISDNESWICLLAAAGLGLLLLIPLVSLARRFPEMDYIEYGAKLVTRPVAAVLGVMLLTLQVHMTAGIIMDISMFLNSSMMRNTSYGYFTVLISLAVALTARVGIGRFAGMFGLLMLSVMLFVVFNISLASPGFHPAYMIPLFDEGFKPIWHGIYFIYGFPYGELAMFCMLLPLVRSKARTQERTGRKLALAVALNAASLLAVTQATVLIFGPLSGERKYSMFEVARTVYVTEIFERLEALMGYSMIVASFMKATIVLYSAHLTLNSLLKLPRDNRQLLFPLAFLTTLISIAVGLRGQANWDFIVSGIHPLWVFTCGTVPVLVVYAVSLIRRRVV